MRTTLLAVLAFGLAVPTETDADTLFLRLGKTLKIEALSCDAVRCVADLQGGSVELPPSDVVRVEPDDEVDAVLLVEAPAVADPGIPRTVEEIVREAAHKYALPPSLVRAVAAAESGLNPLALSPKGARGVMQLMPETARALGVGNTLDPEENIDGGARLLRRLLEKYRGRVAEALAAYNAGEGAVAKHAGVPPYRETRVYVRRVVKDFERAERENGKESPAREKKP